MKSTRALEKKKLDGNECEGDLKWKLGPTYFHTRLGHHHTRFKTQFSLKKKYKNSLIVLKYLWKIKSNVETFERIRIFFKEMRV